MINIYAGLVTLIGIFLIMIIGFYVMSQSTGEEDSLKVSKAVYRVRRYWFFFLVPALAIILAFTMPLAPNIDQFHEAPQAVVSVDGKMWQWIITPLRGVQTSNGQIVLPLNKSVEFLVTASDVNHGLGIYGPSGDMVTQVQAMPGYTNRLFFKFHQAGQYSILCMEYCGVGHQVMTSGFDVN